MVVFKKLRWKNFLSTGNQFTEMDLSTSRVSLIIGKNGSGKCLRKTTKITVKDNEKLEKWLKQHP